MNRSSQSNITLDPWLALSAGALISIGCLMVASASIVVSDQLYGTPFHFLFRQLSYLLVGVIAVFCTVRIPIIFWEKIGPFLLLVSIFLLALVLVPGIGREINGSQRWIGFGPIGLQVSEVVKMSVVIYLAGYLTRRQKEVVEHLSGFIKPMAILSVLAVLLLLEPDFGATAVIFATVLGVMFLAGVRLWQYFVLLTGVVAAFAVLAVTSPYRLERLTAFLNPWANQFDSGYQLTQSLIAFGRGGIFGVGLGNSIQKLFYLPEAHTDFLFAVLAEELGLVGELVVIGLFTLFVGRVLALGRKAQRAEKPFTAYLTYGFGLWFGLQFMINIGVNSGVLPTKGLTLPFMSYGGSSILVNLAG